MNILNLNTHNHLNQFKDDFYDSNECYLILSTPYELNKIKSILDID